jgi:hypothetical protein
VEGSLVSASELRKAAETLRRLADMHEVEWSVERFYWKFRSPAMPDGWWWRIADPSGDVAVASERDDENTDTAENRIRYIATMHPGVGLALADWLDSEFAHVFGPSEHAIDLARLIVGGAS